MKSIEKIQPEDLPAATAEGKGKTWKSSSIIIQREEAKAALEWLADTEDRRLLCLCFGLEGKAARKYGVLARMYGMNRDQIVAKVEGLLSSAHYTHESTYLKQRELAWRAYHRLTLPEGGFIRELFGFYGPQSEINPQQFALAKISWESLKQKIAEKAAEPPTDAEAGRCSLKEHDFLFPEAINTQIPLHIREVAALFWRQMDRLEKGIAVLGLGLAGYRKHSPEEIAQTLMPGQPFAVRKACGLLQRIQAEASKYAKEAKQWF